MSKLPKILIINDHSIYKKNATSITLRSFFSTLNENEALELFRYDTDNKIEERLKFSSMQIPPKSVPINFIIRRLIKKDCYFDLDSKKEKTSFNISTGPVSKSLKKALPIIIKILLERTLIIPKKKFVEQIDKFLPQVIYTIGDSVYTMRFCLFFAKRYNCPIVLHHMDNWLETIYTSNKYTLIANHIINKYVNKIENKMICGLAISQKLAEEYEKKSGVPYKVLMNTIDHIQPSKLHLGRSDTIFSYAGGLHLSRYEQLKEIERLLCTLSNVRKMYLYIYTSSGDRQSYEKYFNPAITKFYNYLPHNRVYEIFDEADILIHVESFNKNIFPYIKYSISTKIPEYMASGKPILCYAPSDLAVYQYIQHTQSGICVDTIDKLRNAIYILATDISYSCRLGQNGMNAVLRNHHSNVTFNTLKEVFNKSINKVENENC